MIHKRQGQEAAYPYRSGVPVNRSSLLMVVLRFSFDALQVLAKARTEVGRVADGQWSWLVQRYLAPALITASVPGCFASGAIGGGITAGDPAEPTGDGLAARIGVGVGVGDSKGVVQGSAEYHRIGDFNLIGAAVEGGLHVFTPRSYREEPDPGSDEERDRRVLGRLLGGGLTVKARVGLSGWSGAWTSEEGDPGAWNIEGALGVAWAKTYATAGPLSFGVYLSVLRTSYGDDDPRWTVSPNFGVTAPLEPIWHSLVNE